MTVRKAFVALGIVLTLLIAANLFYTRTPNEVDEPGEDAIRDEPREEPARSVRLDIRAEGLPAEDVEACRQAFAALSRVRLSAADAEWEVVLDAEMSDEGRISANMSMSRAGVLEGSSVYRSRGNFPGVCSNLASTFDSLLTVVRPPL